MNEGRRFLHAAVDARPLMLARTGVETYLGEMVHHLVDSGLEIRLTLLTDRSWQAPWEGPRCRTVMVTPRTRLPRSLGDGWMIFDVPRALAADPVDVYFTASTKFPPGPVPTVVTVHDLGWRSLPRAYLLNEVWRQYLWTRWATRRATRLVAVSRFTRDDLVAWVPACADRVRVIREAVGSAWRRIQDSAELDAVRSEVGLNLPFILAVGTLSPKKNLEALIKGFERLRKNGFPQYALVLVGKVGWRADAILAAARCTPGVHLLGYIDDRRLMGLYSAAALYVCPGKYEGFGLTVLEAMACETPVIAARAGALPEVVGDAAVLCQPTPEGLAHAMARVLGDANLRSRLAAQGKKRVQQFSWRRAAEECAALLTEAAETKR